MIILILFYQSVKEYKGEHQKCTAGGTNDQQFYIDALVYLQAGDYVDIQATPDNNSAVPDSNSGINGVNIYLIK